jgi:glutathione S-transferase
LVRIDTDDQMSPEFLSLNPDNKIPAILDPAGPGSKPFAPFESGAILIYLADKAGHFPGDAAGRAETGNATGWRHCVPRPSATTVLHPRIMQKDIVSPPTVRRISPKGTLTTH